MRLYQGDCLEIMAKLDPKSVDMVLCDLPYGRTRNKWDTQIPLDKMWAEFDRIVKDNGVIVLFAQTPFDKQLGSSNPKMLKYEWIWVKKQGSGHLNANKMPLKRHENILVFYKNLPKYNPQMTEGKAYTAQSGRASDNYGKQKSTLTVNYGTRYPTSILEFKSEKGMHPTQKPVALCEYLIKTYTDEGDTVLDCCMGSGTTGVASCKLNREFIGIEKEQQYFDMSLKRISESLAK